MRPDHGDSVLLSLLPDELRKANRFEGGLFTEAGRVEKCDDKRMEKQESGRDNQVGPQK